MKYVYELFLTFVPFISTSTIIIVLILVLNWVLLGRYPEMGNDRKLARQLAIFGITIVGIVAIVLTLPIAESTRNQILALLGVLLSGSLAFSSTTIISNAMAGIMMRITRPFRTGDFIQSGDYFGRVAERGLLDTEIQTEYRELVSLPNTLLISTPVTVIRSSGTIVSATLSLGYDIHHSRIESLLINAATDAELDDAFVQIIELGDYSVTYRVSGLLTDTKSMLTTRSNLFRAILDILHGNEIEIVSPSFMNQRRLDDQQKVISKPASRKKKAVETTKAETIMFDKAEEAEQNENAIETLRNKIHELDEMIKNKTGAEKTKLEELNSKNRSELAELEALTKKGE